MNKVPPLDIYRFEIVLELLGDLETPKYMGSLLRGAFAWSFRRTVCVTKQPVCDGCLLKGNCSYFRIFETELAADHIPYLKGVRKVPHPFVLTPPVDGKTHYKTGDRLRIELKLFGSSVQLLPYYVYVFQNIGENGIGKNNTRFKVAGFSSISDDGSKDEVLSSDGKNVKTALLPQRIPQPDEPDIRNTGSVTLDFITPVRLQGDGKVLLDGKKISPAVLLNGITRRYLALSGLYGGDGFSEIKPGFKFDLIRITENDLKIYDWGRYSNRQKTFLDMSGLTGSITLAGEIKEAIPWLLAGSFVNMGKNTAYGLGQYTIKFN
ncbi:MAG: CRISPR-associated protein Cas6 [Ignavibacteriaceae bacterium]|nr:MAG: CRISPR system precrRNA processing endoribonuclease RAMP protein Cas6 [Chlorobiota bacterium]GJQ31787.1 MAG: CRISPR-associated protein Cas6 [Ignavibacteriaceae bacterium]